MDKQGFQTMLEGRKVPAEKMASALELAERKNRNSRAMTAAALPFTCQRLPVIQGSINSGGGYVRHKIE